MDFWPVRGRMQLYMGDGKEKEFIHINDASEITNYLSKRLLWESNYGQWQIILIHIYSRKNQGDAKLRMGERQRTGQKVDHGYNNTDSWKDRQIYFRSPYPS